MNRRWAYKILWFAGLTAAPLLAGKFVVPLEFYAFRVQEVLDDKRSYLAGAGPYYPSMHVKKIEEGDIGRHTPYAVKKEAEWYTDVFGYRNRSVDTGSIVLVGKSEVTGLGLDQKETLAETLVRQSGTAAYAYSPKEFPDFLSDPRFRGAGPKVVVVTLMERELHVLSPLDRYPVRPAPSWSWHRLLPPFFQVYWDQMLKKPNLLQYVLKSLIYERMTPPEIVDPSNGMLFSSFVIDVFRNYQSDPGLAARAAAALSEYRHEAERRGIRFLFMPVPTKENIYWDRIPDAMKKGVEKPSFTPSLLRELRKAGVETVDLEPVFRKARQDGAVLYRLDDTHWSAEAVRLAAAEIRRKLAEPPPSL